MAVRWIERLFGIPPAALRPSIREAVRRYEAAQTTRNNAKHWQNATLSDADSVIGPDLFNLRNRCRYEIRNNSYAAGIVDTLANDLAGSGPILQVNTDDDAENTRIEEDFAYWSEHCDRGGRMALGEIIRLVVYQLCESGEALFLKTTAESGELALQMIELDRLAAPLGTDWQKNRLGVETDPAGRPMFYTILKYHPGNTLQYNNTLEMDRVAAAHVIHLFRQNRPEQTRGVPWLTPALGLFAQMRRFTLATLDAAETAANLAVVMESTSPDLAAVPYDEVDSIPLERNMFATLPAGWKTAQLKSEHPNTTYKEFQAVILNEIARCLNMPYNVAAGNSSTYNYASGRLDWQVYYRAIKCWRGWFERRLLNPIFAAWITERRLSLKAGAGNIWQTKFSPTWNWPGQEPVDPMKDASTAETRLQTNTTTLALEWSNRGMDWETALEQIAREKKKLKELDITAAEALPQPGTPATVLAGKDDEKQIDED